LEGSFKNFDVLPLGAKINLEYSEQDLQDFAIKHNWEGNGTKESPYIIENMNGLAEMFCIKNSRLYILIKNGTFKYLFFIACQNISIEDCSFLRLTLKKCQSIRIESSTIRNFGLWRTKNNLFSNCNITKIFINFLSKMNNFKNCTIESDEIGSEPQNLAIRQFLKIYPLTVMSVGIYVFYMIYHSLYKKGSLDFITIMSIIVFIIMIVIGILLWLFFALSRKK